MLFQSKTMSRHLLIGGARKVLFVLAGMSSIYSGLADPLEPTKKNEIDFNRKQNLNKNKSKFKLRFEEAMKANQKNLKRK